MAAVAITVFVVNFRHAFYAFFPRHLVRNRVARLYAAYAMVDNVYASTRERSSGSCTTSAGPE